MESPRVDLTAINLKSSEAGRAVVDVHFVVTNPVAVELNLLDVEFAFEPEDDTVVGKEAVVKLVQFPSAIRACSSKCMVVPMDLDYADVDRVVSHTMRAQMSFGRCSSSVSELLRVSVAKVRDFVNVLHPEPSRASGYVNGVHISALSSNTVTLKIILRVSNGNNVPVKLDRAMLALSKEGAQEKQQLSRPVNETISAKSQQRIEIDQLIRFDDLDLPSPGNMCSCKLRMDFWFKDSSHGEYKISQEKSLSFPMLAPAATAQVKQVVFENNEAGEAVARMQLQLNLSLPDTIKLSNQALIDYTITDAQKLKLIAKATRPSHHGDGTILKRAMTMDMYLEPLDDSTFGSALWDVFCGGTNFNYVVGISGVSPEYGMITI